MAIKVVERRPLTLAERTYLPQILAGLKVTWDNMVRPSVTLQYPEERPAIPQNYRGVPTLVMDPNGREKCVSCQLCEFVCPPKAIRITPGEISEDATNAHVEKAPKEFEINMLRCIFCGLCEEACPKDAIYMSETFAPSNFARKGFIYSKDELLIPNPVNDKEKYDIAKGMREAQLKNK